MEYIKIDADIFNTLYRGIYRDFDKPEYIVDGIDKVVFEGETCVIVASNGKRYISRPEKGERFDPEKGLLVALLKFKGVSTSKVQSLLDSAIVKKQKVEKKTDGRKFCKKTKKD